MHALANRLFTAVISLVYLALGICGSISPLLHSPPPQTDVQQLAVSLNYGYLFGIFPMNIVSDILFIAIGVAGVICALTAVRSRYFERTILTLSVIAVFLGFLPWGVSRLWGFMPLWGWTDALFFMTALFSFYFAFVEGPLLPQINEPVSGNQ
jgi:hypothetical protein